MKAFVLAAGKGTRMRPLTVNTPKPMLPVAGKPVIQHAIDALASEVDEVIVLTGFNGKKIREGLDSSEVDVSFAEQEKQLGTAHAISKAEPYVNKKFVCLNGDTLLPEDFLKSFAKKFSKASKSFIAMAEVENPSSYGVLKTDENNIVKEMIEKPENPPSNLVNAGVYGFNQDVFSAIKKTEKSSRGEYEITDSMKFLMQKNKLKGQKIKKGKWIELSRPWELLSANNKLLKKHKGSERRKGRVESGVKLDGWISIGEGTVVKQGTYIKGPVSMGKNCEIGPNAYIRGCTSISDNCKIGAASEVKNSIVMNGTNLPRHNYVGDSVIGKNCNLGSGTKVANLRLDKKEVKVTQKGKKIGTGRQKLGSIIGDNVKTGANSTINPGTVIWNDLFIGPGAKASGEVKKHVFQ